MGSLRRDAGESGHAVGEVAFAVSNRLLVAHSDAGAVAMDLPRGERLAFIAWEHQRVRSGRGEDRQVLADVLGEVRWQVNGPAPGSGLRCGDESLPTDSDGGLLNGDGPFGQVDVAAPQGGEFTEPQSAPSG